MEIEEALKRISFSIAYMGSVVSSTESNDFKIFQSNMLQRWIKGSDSMDDSNEQMTIAGIDISKSIIVFLSYISEIWIKKNVTGLSSVRYLHLSFE